MSDDLQAMKLEGLDDALLGLADVWDSTGKKEERYIYCGETIAQILMQRDDMSFEDAMVFISVNIEGAYVGPTTPVVMWPTHGEGGLDEGC